MTIGTFIMLFFALAGICMGKMLIDTLFNYIKLNMFNVKKNNEGQLEIDLEFVGDKQIFSLLQNIEYRVFQLTVSTCAIVFLSQEKNPYALLVGPPLTVFLATVFMLVAASLSKRVFRQFLPQVKKN